MLSRSIKGDPFQYHLIDKIPYPVLSLNPALEVDYANQRALSLLNVHLDNIAGKRIDLAMSNIFSIEEVESVTKVCVADMKPFRVTAKQVELLRPDGIPLVWLDAEFEPLINEEQKVYSVVCFLKDVTPERIELTSLSSRYDYLNHFFKVAPIAIVCYRGPEFIVDVANEHALAIWGKTLEEVKGKKMEEIFPQVTSDAIVRQKHLEGVERMLRGERHSVSEVELVFYRDGSPHTGWYRYIHEPYTDAFGKVIGTMAIAIEITDQVVAGKRLQVITNSLPTLVSYVDPALQYTFVNKAYEQWFGIDAKHIEGQKVIDIIGKEAYDAVSAHFNKALSGIAGYYEGWIDYSKAGRRYVTASYIPHINESQTVLGVVALINDLTENKIQEERLREFNRELEAQVDLRTKELSRLNRILVEAQKLSKLGSWEWDVLAGKIDWSDEMFGIYGYQEKFAIDFARATERMSPQDAEVSRKRTERFIKEAVDRFSSDGSRTFDMPPLEYRIKLPDGQEKILRNSGKIYLTIEGKLEKIVGAIQDITDIRSTEHQLQVAIEKLQEKNKDLEAFSYVASHDLKEPLRKILTFTSRLKNSGAEAASEYLSRIDGAAQRMMDLIESVLTFSQMSNSEIELTDVDLNRVFENCISDLELRIRETQATITSKNLGIIKANPSQMSQLFSNLIGNSLKFSKEKPLIEVQLERVTNVTTLSKLNATGQPYWCLTFSDNGIGFDAKYREQIFQPFKRLHGRDAYSGTGIGLSIVKKIVERHKGVIEAESVVGKGTKFTIFLPA